MGRFGRTKARLDEVGSVITEKQAKKEQIERFLAELERQDGVATEFDEGQWYGLVDFVTVFNNESTGIRSFYFWVKGMYPILFHIYRANNFLFPLMFL